MCYKDLSINKTMLRMVLLQMQGLLKFFPQEELDKGEQTSACILKVCP